MNTNTKNTNTNSSEYIRFGNTLMEQGIIFEPSDEIRESLQQSMTEQGFDLSDEDITSLYTYTLAQNLLPRDQLNELLGIKVTITMEQVHQNDASITPEDHSQQRFGDMINKYASSEISEDQATQEPIDLLAPSSQRHECGDSFAAAAPQEQDGATIETQGETITWNHPRIEAQSVQPVEEQIKWNNPPEMDGNSSFMGRALNT